MNEHEFNGILSTLQSHHDLSLPQMRATIGWMLGGEAQPEDMRQVLELLAEKGESVSELAGAAQALRDSMRSVANPYPTLVDTCGTGGDGSKTFNISTAAALVTAAAGVPVAKHGNRKITSSTGSADVLAELGINLEAPPATVHKCLVDIGICFCFAPHFHPAMRHVGPVRREIPKPTIFNRLGPLANPAGANCQVLGVGAAQLQTVMASALMELGTQHSIVVRGEDGVDEVSLSGATKVLEVIAGKVTEFFWHPDDFGLPTADRGELFADDPASSAACIREVLSGQLGPKRNVVLLNSAAAIWLANPQSDLKQCTRQAAEAIDSGRAQQIVDQLGELTQSHA